MNWTISNLSKDKLIIDEASKNNKQTKQLEVDER